MATETRQRRFDRDDDSQIVDYIEAATSTGGTVKESRCDDRQYVVILTAHRAAQVAAFDALTAENAATVTALDVGEPVASEAECEPPEDKDGD